MIENVRKYPVSTILVISFYYLVGIIGLSMEATRPLFQALVPFTLLCSLYFLWLFHENPSGKAYVSGLIIFLLGFLVEAIGVNTGAIFGHYVYGETLGFQVWNTPLMIGVNWLLLVYSSWALTGLFTSNRFVRYFSAALLMVLYDIVLEPVAIRLDMWNWHGEDIPIQNYTGWFLLSLILIIILDLAVKPVRNKIAPALFIIQLVFFVVLRLVFHLI
jgi:putative membrane protein